MRGWVSMAASLAVVLGTFATAAASTPNGAQGVQRVSERDPLSGCTLDADPADPTDILYPGSKVEPAVAVDPRNPNTVIGVFQQDRWTGDSRGIAAVYSSNGHDFSETTLPFSSCAPGGLPQYFRASDPWVSIGPDGTAYAVGLGVNFTPYATGVVAATSHDGGRTWRDTTSLIQDGPTYEYGDDKPSVTADPVRAGTAYATWDRVYQGPNGDGSVFSGPAMLSVTHDSGRTWSKPRAMVSTGPVQITQSNLIRVDPRTGRIYNFFDLITFTDTSATTTASADQSVIHSDDGGLTWSSPVTVTHDTSVTDTDPANGVALRSGEQVESAAIDPRTGELYVVAEGTEFTGGAYDQVKLVHSTDGGRTWSAPVRVNGAPQAMAFSPSVAVTDSGVVGVTYYDIRTLPAGDTTTLPTSTWLATSPSGGEHFTERSIAAPFDLLSAPNASGPFLGDYQGLAATPGGFRPLFIQTNQGQPDDLTDVFTGWFPAVPADVSAGQAMAVSRH